MVVDLGLFVLAVRNPVARHRLLVALVWSLLAIGTYTALLMTWIIVTIAQS